MGCQEEDVPVEEPPHATAELPAEEPVLLAEPTDEEVLISDEVVPTAKQPTPKRKRTSMPKTEKTAVVPALKGMRRARLAQTAKPRPALGNQQIKRIITERVPQVRACYERELKKSPGLGGKVLVAWTIREDGTVSSPRVSKNTTGSSRLAPCITKAVARWRFPESSSTSDVEYPFVFKAKEDWR
jgi:outer membrane biosynthesis protein TonB